MFSQRHVFGMLHRKFKLFAKALNVISGVRVSSSFFEKKPLLLESSVENISFPQRLLRFLIELKF